MKGLNSFLGPVSSKTETFITSQPILFTLIIMYQGLFSGNAIKIPKKLEKFFNNKTFRFMSIMLIAFVATKDIEYALVSTLTFLIIMYSIKTPEEREKTGFI